MVKEIIASVVVKHILKWPRSYIERFDDSTNWTILYSPLAYVIVK